MQFIYLFLLTVIAFALVGILRILKRIENRVPSINTNEYNDSLYEEAKKAVIANGFGTASFLQRKLKIGYARATYLLDHMEEEGLIEPADGAKPRKVIINQ